MRYFKAFRIIYEELDSNPGVVLSSAAETIGVVLKELPSDLDQKVKIKKQRDEITIDWKQRYIRDSRRRLLGER